MCHETQHRPCQGDYLGSPRTHLDGVGNGGEFVDDKTMTTEDMDRMLQWSTVSMELTKLITMEYGRPAQHDLTDIHHRFRQTHQEETQRLRFVATMNTTQRDDT